MTAPRESYGAPHRHVVMFSSGAGSWAAARRVADEHGTDNLWLVFSDVSMEDEDNYRFLLQAAADIYGVRLSFDATDPRTWGPEVAARDLPRLVWLRDGRDIWQVFKDDAFLGNTRLANCSKFLKQKPARAWLDANCDAETTTVYVGIDWTEAHRLPAIVRNYQPYRAEAPMTEAPLIDRERVFQLLRMHGLQRPRLYDLGFQHANCGGGCVRAGQGQFAHLLKVMPERYLWWEQNEEDLRQHLDKDVSILRDRTLPARLARLGLTTDDVELRTEAWTDDDGEERESSYYVRRSTGEEVSVPAVVPLTLRTFRERHEAQPEQTDLFDIGGCGCFVDEGGAA